MKTQTLIIVLLILIFGILSAYFTSKKLYQPIGKMVHELDSYELDKKDRLYNLGVNFLKSIILESTKYEKTYLKDKFIEYNINLEVEQRIRIINLIIDEFPEVTVKHGEEGIQLLKYAISNIIIEVSSQFFKIQCVDIKNNEVVVLINTGESNKSIEELIAEIQFKIKELLRISLTATYSLKECFVNDISPLYNTISEASLNRLIYGYGSIINADKIEELKKKIYEYPAEEEKSMINALIFGNLKEVNNSYSEIIENSFNYSYKEINMSIFHLIFAIDNALNKMKRNSLITIEFNVNSVIEIFKSAETIENINVAFFKLFESICDAINEKKKSKHEDLINKIIDLINTNYGNQDIGIEKLADSINMNPTYIGRLFKINTQLSINEFINDVRIKNAREMLKYESNTIEDISKKCGFSNLSYFYKIFKNLNGTTPNEFRKKIIEKQITQ